MKNIKVRVLTVLRDSVVNGVASSALTPYKLRFLIYKTYGMNVKTVNIKPRCFFGNNNISIGENSFINYGNFFDTDVSVGNNCSIGYNSVFASVSHEIGESGKRAGSPYVKPIIIGNGTWIGANATVLPGVTIGEGCIIASGAVVTENCLPNGLYAGVPARRVKELNTQDVPKAASI